MPMPRLPEIHHSATASARAFQVKKNSAAMAPTWNTTMKLVVTQLMGWAKVLSRSKMLMTSAVLTAGKTASCSRFACDQRGPPSVAADRDVHTSNPTMAWAKMPEGSRSGLARPYLPESIGTSGERGAEESVVASQAAKGPDKDHGKNDSLEEAFAF